MFNIGDEFEWNTYKCIVTSINEKGFKYKFKDTVPWKYRYVNGFMMFSFKWLERNMHKITFSINIKSIKTIKLDNYGE